MDGVNTQLHFPECSWVAIVISSVCSHWQNCQLLDDISEEDIDTLEKVHRRTVKWLERGEKPQITYPKRQMAQGEWINGGGERDI